VPGFLRMATHVGGKSPASVGNLAPLNRLTNSFQINRASVFMPSLVSMGCLRPGAR
jgi:hypothetical protein